MCVVSQITDYGRKIWPDPWSSAPMTPGGPPFQEYPKFYPAFPAIPAAPAPKEEYDEALLKKFKEFMELINKAKETDVILDQPDCPDPEKAEWIKKLEDRIADLEKKLDNKQDKMHYWNGLNGADFKVIPYKGG